MILRGSVSGRYRVSEASAWTCVGSTRAASDLPLADQNRRQSNDLACGRLARHRNWRALRFLCVPVVAMQTAFGNEIKAQTATGSMPIEGVAYDSLAKRPLVGAIVYVVGTDATSTSDERGRFRLVRVPVGNQTIGMQHSAFDSLGLSGTTVRVDVQPKMPRLVLAVPSFPTIWRVLCGETVLNEEATIVFGTVRSATDSQPRSAAVVQGVWTELIGSGRSLASIQQQRMKLSTLTDDRGDYALCGVATGPTLTLRLLNALDDSLPLSEVELPTSIMRVRRQDVFMPRAAAVSLPAVDDSASGARITSTPPSSTGVIAGIITDSVGVPLANATVVVDTMTEVRSGDDGRFFVRNLPSGSHRLAVISIGRRPFVTVVNVMAGDTARITIPIASIQTLDAVNVRATVMSVRLRDFEERKRMGFGDHRDSTEIKQYPSAIEVLKTVNGVTIRQRSRLNFTISIAGCGKPDFRLDGLPSTPEDIALLDTRDIAAMEVYRRTIPTELMSGRGGCPIMVWTKNGLKR